MDISLIICSRNRCQQLARCLESVRKIAFERTWQLIIVDNGSTDETATVVRRLFENGDFQATYIFEPAAGRSRALNTALRIAHGQILAFTDDDCYPAPDFLTQIWAAFDEDPSVGYIGGRILLHDPTDIPITINESTTPLTFPGRSFVCEGSVSGANMAFRRAVLLEVGGFDPLFGPGALFAADDIDLVGRASSAGWKGQYRPEVVVRHHHGRKIADFAPLMKDYLIGAGAYHMKFLLRGHEFLWFKRSIRDVYWQLLRVGEKRVFPQKELPEPIGVTPDITMRRLALWRLLGMLKYTYVYSEEAIRASIDRLKRLVCRSDRGRYAVDPTEHLRVVMDFAGPGSAPPDSSLRFEKTGDNATA